MTLYRVTINQRPDALSYTSRLQAYRRLLQLQRLGQGLEAQLRIVSTTTSERAGQ